MDAYISGIYLPTADDIAGAQFLYGPAGVSTPPANDNFANAIPLTLTNNTVQVTGSNVYATKEPGEPDHAPGETGGTSVWWKWTAPANGTLVATTAGSEIDTMLGAYTGTAVNALTQLAANDDESASPHIRSSKVTLASVTYETTYYFAVDGWDGNFGPVALNLTFTPAGVPPTFTSSPSDQSVSVGQTASFTVAATGTPAPTYQWQRRPAGSGTWTGLADDAGYTGSTTSTLAVGPATSAMTGDQFRCVATNAAAAITSGTATLTVNLLAQSLSFAGPADQPFSLTPLTLSATGGGSGNPVTFSVRSGPASVSGTNGATLTLTGSGAVTVRAAQAGNATYAAAPSVDRSFNVSGNLDAWRYANFTAGDLTNPAISGPNAIYGQDGLPNLVKYALGLPAQANATTGLPVLSSDGTNWIYTYTRATSASDVTVTVELSTNLTSWSSAGLTPVKTGTAGGFDTWQVTYPQASAPNAFFRLNVTQ